MRAAVIIASILVAHGNARGEVEEPRPAHHVRLTTSNGPVHVWKPANYDVETAGIVVYVHGYFVDVDQAWRDHRLAAQFERSELSALFIACEAPVKASDKVVWSSLESLLSAVKQGLDEELPGGDVTVVVHSGGHWTLRSWLQAPARMDALVMLDAAYGEFPDLHTWLSASSHHRLITIGELTRPWADALHASLPDTRLLDELPATLAGWQSAIRGERVVYLRSQVGHFELVTGGRVLPMVLAPDPRETRERTRVGS